MRQMNLRPRNLPIFATVFPMEVLFDFDWHATNLCFVGL